MEGFFTSPEVRVGIALLNVALITWLWVDWVREKRKMPPPEDQSLIPRGDYEALQPGDVLIVLVKDNSLVHSSHWDVVRQQARELHARGVHVVAFSDLTVRKLLVAKGELLEDAASRLSGDAWLVATESGRRD